MICPNCNQVIDDDSKFCVYCGTSVQTVTTVSSESSLPTQEESSLNGGNDTNPNYQEIQQTMPNQSIMQDSEKEHKKKKSPVLWIIAIALVVIAGGTVVFLSLTVFKKPQFNLNDYMYVLDSGFDGYGTVTIGINEKLLRESCRGQFGEKKITESSKAESALLSLMTSGSFDKSDYLSNGDNVSYTLNFNKGEFEKQYGIKVEVVPVDYEISNLQPLTEHDVFADLYIEVIGYSGIAKMYVSYNETVPGIDISWDKNVNLSNGDIVTFTLEEEEGGQNIEELTAAIYGYKLKRTSYEYKVEGLEELVIIEDDLLQYAEVEYYGYPVDVVPYITATVSSEALNERYPELDLEYYVDCNGRTRNGKELTIGLCYADWTKQTKFENIEDLKKYLNQFGYDYSGSVIKTVTVSGLTEYVTSLSDIPDDLIVTIAQDSREYLDARIASNFEMWRETRPVESMELIGLGFSVQEMIIDDEMLDDLTNFSASSTFARNKLYALFEVKVPAGGETRTIYFYCMWTELVKEADGTVILQGGMGESPMGEYDLKLDYNGEIVYGFTSVDELIEYIKPENNGWVDYKFETNLPGY